jgi:hypothetical protein
MEIILSNKNKFELSLTVASTLGGLTLTALAVLMSSETPLTSTFSQKFFGIVDYKEILIVGLGVVSTLFIVSVVGLKGVIVNPEYENKLYAKTSFGFYEAGFVGLFVLFPLLIMAFNSVAGWFIIIIEATWGGLGIFNRLKYRPPEWLRRRRTRI